jgi:ATP-dependent Lon protease
MDDDESRKIYEEVDHRELELDDELALLPIRNHVLFPGSVAPFDVGREKSVALVEDLEGETQPVIVIFAQKDPSTDDPAIEDLYPVGQATATVMRSEFGVDYGMLVAADEVVIRVDAQLIAPFEENAGQ